ncbi:hypothetical protein BJ322DRAFT_1106808 [Thelephora terrestris]|uniref:Uncharacterized protein n=1 Tax=Thelephora terrestris TaxID=56493 RepID=A0A9P6L8E3_9AGAM|nr:hypothetical protein BJ322DRAFT_1106808 [Thelephora terrestris]
MDPAHLNKNIFDLSDAELIALGFLGENVAPGVKRIIDKAKADPDRLCTVTCFVVDCLKSNEAETLYSELSNDSDARTVVAPT